MAVVLMKFDLMLMIDAELLLTTFGCHCKKSRFFHNRKKFKLCILEYCRLSCTQAALIGRFALLVTIKDVNY